MRTPALPLLSILLTLVAEAHQDPLGDLDPQVKVENDRFVIYFGNNEATEDASIYSTSEDLPVYRMVYSPAGELLGPRSP